MAELLADVEAHGATVLLQQPGRHGRETVGGPRHLDTARVLAGELDELRAAVPQRFVDIHYRGAALYIVSAIAELADLEATAGRLLQNQADMRRSWPSLG